MLVSDGADELEADGKASGSETTGDGDGGKAGEIGGTIGPEQERARGSIAGGDGFLTDEWGGDGRRWDDQGVDFRVFQGQMELLDEFFAEFESGQISRGAYLVPISRRVRTSSP